MKTITYSVIFASGSLDAFILAFPDVLRMWALLPASASIAALLLCLNYCKTPKTISHETI